MLASLEQTVSNIEPLNDDAMESARERQQSLTKPEGSLGYLEEISVRLAGIFEEPAPVIRRKLVILAAADHGVVSEGVSAYPQEVTSQMVANFLGGGAAINVLARQVGAEVVVVDAGVAKDLPAHPKLELARVGRGTANIAKGAAMSRSDAVKIVEAGIAVAAEKVSGGVDILGTGDMGIGNTTASSAITAVVTGADPDQTTGRGTGVSESGLRHKTDVVRRALEVNQPDPADGIDVLAKVGGFEIGFLAGVVLGGAEARRPVVLDGFVSGAAALIACTLCPCARDYLIAAHRSAEPGHGTVLSHLGLRPLLELDMRLGEGAGAALAMHLVEAAAKCMAEMATFTDAGVSDRS